MDAKEARKKIKALKGFYQHLLMYVAFAVCFLIANAMTYRSGDPAVWAVFPIVFWGACVLMHGVSVHTSFGWGKRWEEEKFRQLTGWSATQDELTRLSERVEALLTILSSDHDRVLGSELAQIRETLLDAKKSISYYQSPLDKKSEPPLDKRGLIKAIETLEAIVTSRAFRHLDDTPAR